MSTKKTRFHPLVENIIRYKRMIVLLTIVIIACTTINTAIATLLNSSNSTIPSQGTLKTIGVEVYEKPNTHKKLDVINWKEIWVGSTNQVTIYIRSISNYKVSLNLESNDWVPNEISDYIKLSWDYNGKELEPNEVIEVTLTLSISNSLTFVDYLINEKVKTFNHNINIIAA